MKTALPFLLALALATLPCLAGVRVDEEAFGKSLGGWKNRNGQAVEYPLSGATYRTYKPVISPTPEGGIFISLRIDHVRGWLSSDDHAVLEITVNAKGAVASAQSNIAIQGRSITSDLIVGGVVAGQELATPERAVQIGTLLVADLSAKLLREKLVEAGRVSFPAVLRHNYNLLFQSIRTEDAPVPAPAPTTPAPAPGEPAKPDAPSANLEIKPYGDKPKAELPVKN